MLFTTKAQLTAAIKRAESAEAEVARLADNLARRREAHERTSWLLQESEQRNGELRRQLAAFTGPRDRKPNGQFASGKVGS